MSTQDDSGVLEAHAAARTAVRMTDKISAELHKIIDEMGSTTDSHRLSQLDTQFHQVVNAASGNDAHDQHIRLSKIEVASRPEGVDRPKETRFP